MGGMRDLAARLLALDDKIAVCMRCGMCQSVCPTFGLSRQEGDVARGRLALINNMAHKLLRDPAELAEKLERCLLCASCQAVCPSGVKLMEIFREAREIVYGYIGLSPIKKLVFRSILPIPGLFNFVVKAGVPAQKLLFKKTGDVQGTVRSPLLKPLLGDRHIKPLPSRTLREIYGSLDEPKSAGGIKAAFFPGCVADKMYVELGSACIKVLKHHNVSIFMPASQICCGIPAICSGDATGMLKELERNLREFAGVEFDYLLTPCASCTSTIRELWPEYAKRLSKREQAEEIALKTMDICEFLVKVLGITPKSPPAQTARIVTVHDPCHLRSLGVVDEPRKTIASNPACKLVEMHEHDRCCGNGGSFNLLHYEFSRGIGQRKRNNIVESGAEIVATGCPACMMQLEDLLSQNGDSILVRHPVQLYAEGLDNEEAQ